MTKILLAVAVAMACSSASLAATRTSPTAAASAPQVRFNARTERGQLAGSLVLKWAGYVSRVYGVSPTTWARSMGGTFSQADIGNMRRALGMKTYEAMTSALLGQKMTDAQAIDRLAQSSGPISLGTLGSPAGDLVYTMITPCRILDTRAAGGAIVAHATRSFQGVGANFTGQGGSATNCGIPANPSAIVMNVTVVNPALAGYLTAFPFGVTRPTAASMNYKAGDVLGNEIVVKQTIGDAYDFSFYSTQQADYVADAVGYFTAPAATALDCKSITYVANIVAASDIDAQIFTPTGVCGAGYAVTSGNCWGHYPTVTTVGSALISGQLYCRYTNSSAEQQATFEYITCCRVPGR